LDRSGIPTYLPLALFFEQEVVVEDFEGDGFGRFGEADDNAFFVETAGVGATGFFEELGESVGEVAAALFEGDGGDAEMFAGGEEVVVGEAALGAEIAHIKYVPLMFVKAWRAWEWSVSTMTWPNTAWLL